MFRHLPVDIIQLISAVWNQHFLHDGQLFKSVAAHLDKFHKGAAGNLALAQTDGGQLRASLGDADELLIQRPQPICTNHQLNQTRAGEANTSQHVFADRAAKVQMRHGDLVLEERAELFLVKEKVHD